MAISHQRQQSIEIENVGRVVFHTQHQLYTNFKNLRARDTILILFIFIRRSREAFRYFVTLNTYMNVNYPTSS